MKENILDKLTKLAIQKTWPECSGEEGEEGEEYFNPDDYAEGGKNDGAIELARYLLKLNET